MKGRQSNRLSCLVCLKSSFEVTFCKYLTNPHTEQLDGTGNCRWDVCSLLTDMPLREDQLGHQSSSRGSSSFHLPAGPPNAKCETCSKDQGVSREEQVLEESLADCGTGRDVLCHRRWRPDPFHLRYTSIAVLGAKLSQSYQKLSQN